MRTTVLAVVAIISLPIFSLAQSTLSFPRVVPPAQFGTTGFAVVNPGAAPATVTFTLYGNGTSQKTQQTIPARGQRARLASELFPTAQSAGWVEATSATPGLQGFWLGGNFQTFADGAEAATPSSELVIPLIAPQSEINIVNTADTDVTVLLDLLGPEGKDLDTPYPQRIPARGFFASDVVSLFPSLGDPTLATHMRIQCGCDSGNAFAAVVVAKDFIAGPSWAVVNAVPASTSTLTINFPHVVDGPQGAANWKSVIGVTNLSAADNPITISFMSEAGAILDTAQQTLPPNGGVRTFARDLFPDLAPFYNGWAQVSGSGPITGFIAYAEMTAAGVAVVPPQQDSQTNLLFAHIADLPPFFTGLALLNTNGSAAANVKVFAITPDGALIGSAAFSLAAGAKTSKLLSELIPQTQSRTMDGGFVFVSSDLPLFGIELFFSRDTQFLSNVSAGRVLPGIVFVPPTP